jgi:F-type H+-transporting ATPase subunit delta
MSTYRVSYRYAKALLQLAGEKKILNKISVDGELIYNTIFISKELRSVLKSPVVKLNIKKSLVNKIFENKISQETMSFLDFVIEKNREDILLEIFREFLLLIDKENNVISTKVVSAIALNDETKQSIVHNFENRTGKNIKANFNIDPELIGGFIIKIEDTVYDASIKNQLQLLRKKFSEEINVSNN